MPRTARFRARSWSGSCPRAGRGACSTPRAATGLDVRDGESCLLAGSAEEFAAALVEVLRDGAPELALRGRELAAERYSVEALSRLLAP
jgi:hypothetical protein